MRKDRHSTWRRKTNGRAGITSPVNLRPFYSSVSATVCVGPDPPGQRKPGTAIPGPGRDGTAAVERRGGHLIKRVPPMKSPREYSAARFDPRFSWPKTPGRFVSLGSGAVVPLPYRAAQPRSRQRLRLRDRRSYKDTGYPPGVFPLVHNTKSINLRLGNEDDVGF